MNVNLKTMIKEINEDDDLIHAEINNYHVLVCKEAGWDKILQGLDIKNLQGNKVKKDDGEK